MHNKESIRPHTWDNCIGKEVQLVPDNLAIRKFRIVPDLERQ